MSSIIKRKKAYSLVYNYTDDKGEVKQKWETWHTDKDALKRKAEVENELIQGTFITPNKQTVEEFMFDYVSLYGEKKLGVSTYDSSCALIANYINPIMGTLPVQDLRDVRPPEETTSVIDIATLVAELTKSPELLTTLSQLVAAQSVA